jgi:hypothetical protein
MVHDKKGENDDGKAMLHRKECEWLLLNQQQQPLLAPAASTS